MRQALRSEIPRVARIWSTQARRRAGLSSFPTTPPSGSACRASVRTLPGAAGHSLARGPSMASLEVPQWLRLIDPEAAVLTAPPVAALLRCTKPPAHLADRPSWDRATSASRRILMICSRSRRWLIPSSFNRGSNKPDSLTQPRPLFHGKSILLRPTHFSRMPWPRFY